MKINVEISERELRLWMHADELDAIPAVDMIWFRSDRKLQIDACRTSLLAFLMTADLIGNVFEVQGAAIPAHLATEMPRYMPGHELFVHGVSNLPSAIIRPPRYSALIVPPVQAGALTAERADIAPPLLYVRRTTLGYEYLDARGEIQLGLATNMDLHLAMHASQPELVASAVLYLYCYDTLRPAALGWSREVWERNVALVNCLKEAGGNVV